MYTVDMTTMSEEFLPCWVGAARHLDARMDGGIQSWLRRYPDPPYVEHLSFRLGNQLFFVRVEDADRNVEGPSNPDALRHVASLANGHACVMPMRKVGVEGNWLPTETGWGLLDAATRKLVDPLSLVSDALIEMTDWEVHDMAVEVVRQQLRKEGYEVTSWHGNRGFDPSIWFVGDSKGLEWVVVRATRYPAMQAERPSSWMEIAATCSSTSSIGHFASVALANVEQASESAGNTVVPLWRGHGTFARFTGLE